MLAKDIISHDALPLRISDTGEDALSMMNLFLVKHLPIVSDTKFLGLISEDIILNHDIEEAVGSYSLSLVRPFVRENDHLFEVMSRLAENNLTLIPVLNKEDNYSGLISLEDLLSYFAKNFSFSEPGSILVLKTSKPQYSLSEISRIVESENASIISTFLTSEDQSNGVYVTLKINKQDINSIIASFVRFDYEISATFSDYEYIDDLKERYDSLMNYLSI